MMNNCMLNEAVLCGTIYEITKYPAEGNVYMEAVLKVKRLSGTPDYVPVRIGSEVIRDTGWMKEGDRIRVTGTYTSFHTHDEEGSHLKHQVIAETTKEAKVDDADENEIRLTGYLCKAPIFRVTPLGRKLTDIMIAVNHDGRSSYIPCILWGSLAAKYSEEKVGSQVHIRGRIQSRLYQKRREADVESRTTYEVSAFSCELIEEEKKVS